MITKCTYKSLSIMHFTYTDLGEWFCTGFISLVVSSGSLVWKKKYAHYKLYMSNICSNILNERWNCQSAVFKEIKTL